MAEHPMADLRRKLHAAGLLAKPAGKSWSKVIFLFIIVGGLIYTHTQITLIQGLIILPITSFAAISVSPVCKVSDTGLSSAVAVCFKINPVSAV